MCINIQKISQKLRWGSHNLHILCNINNFMSEIIKLLNYIKTNIDLFQLKHTVLDEVDDIRHCKITLNKFKMELTDNPNTNQVIMIELDGSKITCYSMGSYDARSCIFIEKVYEYLNKTIIKILYDREMQARYTTNRDLGDSMFY